MTDVGGKHISRQEHRASCRRNQRYFRCHGSCGTSQLSLGRLCLRRCPRQQSSDHPGGRRAEHLLQVGVGAAELPGGRMVWRDTVTQKPSAKAEQFLHGRGC